jgi:hypothetical protein
MKELNKIIESLHTINQQIIEKDNIINNYTDLINLFSQLMSDPDFIKSEIYLDLKIKYLSQIEEKLKALTERPTPIVIEPENPINTTTINNAPDKKKFTSSEVKAPIMTDIYVAPNNRRQFAKKKTTKQPTQKKSNISLKIEDNDKPREYLQFMHNETDYYIDTMVSISGSGSGSVSGYNIYDRYLQIAGHLKGSTITLLNNHDLSQSTTIQLGVIASTKISCENEKILDSYVIM